MFRIEVVGITASKFEDIYTIVLDTVNAETESDKPISVGDFVNNFLFHFESYHVRLKWEPQIRDGKYEWLKNHLFNYSVMNLTDGVSFELEEPVLVDKLPENHDIKTEDCCLVKASEKIVDGGKRMSFGEGLAEREPADGKGRYDLITPFGIRRLAIWYELGAKKYADRNWEKGMPFSRYIDAAKRHLDKYIMGMTDEDHLAAAAWNILSIMHHEELGQMEFDDMPHYMSDESQKERFKKQLNALYGMKEEEKDHE